MMITEYYSIIKQALQEDPEISHVIRMVKDGSNFPCFKFTLKMEEVELIFQVEIPFHFPVNDYLATSLKFYCKEIQGYPHQMENGWICLHPVNDDQPERKVKEEISLLKDWVRTFVINEEQDPDAPILISSDKYILQSGLIYTQVNKQFLAGETGEYHSWIHKDSLREMILDIDGADCSWARKHHATISLPGFWLFIDGEPVKQRKIAIQSWLDLKTLLDQTQWEGLKSYLTKNLDSSILIGHYLEGTEWVKWYGIAPPEKNIRKSIIQEKALDKPLLWRATQDASYELYFGRGKLTDELTEAKILLIGCGAIGSQLLDMLVRGGCKYLWLSDFDVVEAGNICRGQFTLHQLGFTKTKSLQFHAESLSPFVEINTTGPGLAYPKNSDEFNKLSESLEIFDIIFDCSTDMGVALSLDKISPEARVINLSLGGSVEALVGVTGNKVVRDKAMLLDEYQQSRMDLFKPPGCAYPTFRASYVDISSLLGLAIRHINHQLEKGNSLSNFMVRWEEEDGIMQANLLTY
ncbi:MAG: ThiF family adenylyltransferase [Bacteroidia bacterium]|nr:ThiF family adenylyltransferase [Bacteroidia bacterium]